MRIVLLSYPSVAHLLAFSFLFACGGSNAPPLEAAEDPIAALNERARAGSVTDELHGVSVADPYRALETESELTTAWVNAQTQRTREAIEPNPQTRDALAELFQIGSISRVSHAGERIFFSRREGEAEQPVYVVREGDEEHPLIDPTTFGERAALDWVYPSPSGRLLAFGISHNGDERSTLHLMDVGARIADPAGGIGALRIERTKWTSITWRHDESGFYYTRYPKPGEEGFDAESEDAYFPRVYFHSFPEESVSADSDENDPLVFGGARPTDFPSAALSADDETLVINNFRGWAASDVYVLRGQRVPDEEHPFVAVIEGEDATTYGSADADGLVLMTSIDAPRFRIVRVPFESLSDRTSWTDLVAQQEGTLDGWTFAGEGIVTHHLESVRSVLRYVAGETVREIALPGVGSISDLSGEAGEASLAFGFEGNLRPPSVVRVNLDGEALAGEVVTSVQTSIDLSAFQEEQVEVSSADGTRVPVTLLSRRDRAEGPTPTILYGYGGFSISLMPGLRRNALYWLQRGGVYAIANLRGGGEFGDDWHRAGMLENKPRVFEDFEAVIRWLSESGRSRPDQIGITGGSNGGLLMGAMIARVPSTFGAAASYVGLYDMVRYHHFPPAELWISEYGSSEDETLFPVLRGYSPYHNIPAGQRLPAILIETADHDSRVHWAHSTKFTAALQEANAGPRPIYFYMEREMGHGAGTRHSDRVEKYARMYTFFESQLMNP